MSERGAEFFGTAVENWDQGLGLMERLVGVAKPDAVFGKAIQVGDHTVITASEVTLGLGFAYGFGSGSGEAPEDEEAEPGQQSTYSGGGGGGAGGGGGGARPVAAIIVEPEGVRVEPIVDFTKLGLALFTALGSMFVLAGRMRRAARG